MSTSIIVAVDSSWQVPIEVNISHIITRTISYMVVDRSVSGYAAAVPVLARLPVRDGAQEEGTLIVDHFRSGQGSCGRERRALL